jgi:hypothetical protein
MTVRPNNALLMRACFTQAEPVCPSSTPVSGQLQDGILKISYPAIQAEGRYRVNGEVLEGQMVDWKTGKVLIWVTATRLP